ncbi:MAG TPA: HAMP domain-containing sensor histidine kinase [Gemmatimonadaceae bacterium]|jgi:signal transduction histidine kinase|nr:HAMP domain-containing sensor histidine kinase [Gemmatimonadaceae bacterium]
MLSTRVKLTAAFVAGLVAVTITLFLAVLAARNDAVYHDIAQYAAAQGDLAGRVIAEAEQSGERVVATSDTALIQSLSPKIIDRLQSIPGYLVVVDNQGRAVYRSNDVLRLQGSDMVILQTQLGDLPKSGEALIFSLDALQEKLLFVSHSLAGSPSGLSRIASGAVATRATTVPPEYMFDALIIVPLIIAAAGIGAFLFLGRTQRQLGEITTEVAAITDGRSLHRRLALSEETTDFAGLVTTLNAMIGRLETSFAGLRRFTADASHELKTPLAVLRADVERAMTETASQNERMVALEEALQEVRRMSDLVESLLTLARADEGRFDLHREPVELEPLVQEVYETALILGEAQGITVNLPFTADATVMADRTRLRQLFLNLVTNAIKYTPAGGKVELGLGRHPDNVTFAVRDTGIGISAADFPHIFERFWRADRVRSRMSERGGFGLGLAISQWIAQAHGGTLTASSRLGRGSLFTVTLPLAGDVQKS